MIVHDISVQVSGPTRSRPEGQLEFGHYVVSGNRVTLTNKDGTALTNDDTGEGYERFLREGEDHKLIARVLLRATVSPFKRPINYPSAGVI